MDRKNPSSPWFGLHLPNYTYPGTPPERLFDRVVEQARAAEDAGFAQLTVMDHLYQIGGVGSPDQPMLEAYTTLGALARETTRVRLGVMVTGVTYRNPALLAKQVTTLDTISGGRAMFGIGAAWNEVEHVGYGYPFPPIRERMDRLEEAVQIARAMFTQEVPTFEGRYYRIEQALNVPRPLQKGGPRILIGGGGEKRTLKIAARYADMTHWFSIGVEALRRKTGILEGYCAEIGRDPATIERTMGSPVILTESETETRALLARIPAERRSYLSAGTPSQTADALRPYLDAGFTGFTFGNTILRTPEKIAAAGELLRLIS